MKFSSCLKWSYVRIFFCALSAVIFFSCFLFYSEAAVGVNVPVSYSVNFRDYCSDSDLVGSGTYNSTYSASHSIKTVFYLTIELGEDRITEPGTYLINLQLAFSAPPVYSTVGSLNLTNEWWQFDLLSTGEVITLDYNTQGYYTYSVVSGGLNYLFFRVTYTADATYTYNVSNAYAYKDNTITYSGNVQCTRFSATMQSPGTLEDKLAYIQSGIDQVQDSQDELMNGYDASAGSSSNSQLQGSIDDYQAAEDNLFNSQKGSLDSFDPSSILTFSVGIASGLSFCSSFITSFFTASGDYAVIVGVLFTVALLSIILGIYRFGHWKGGG